MEWLKRGGKPTNDGKFTRKPWLHCDHDFAIKQTIDDLAHDHRGNIMKHPETGEDMRIRDVSKYMQRRKTRAEKDPLAKTEQDVFPVCFEPSRLYQVS